MFWLLIILVLVIVMFIGFGFFRKWFRNDEVPEANAAFSLSDLRRMLKDGRLTQQEYDRLKSQVVATLKQPSKPAGNSGDVPPQGNKPLT